MIGFRGDKLLFTELVFNLCLFVRIWFSNDSVLVVRKFHMIKSGWQFSGFFLQQEI